MIDHTEPVAVDDEDLDEVESDGEEAPRPLWKPDISHLPDAVVVADGVPTMTATAGDRIIIDYSGLKYGAWMDTRCWVIKRVDQETGYVSLYDPIREQGSCTNWRQAASKGLLIKIPSNRDWKAFQSASGASRKRARRIVARAIQEERAESASKIVIDQDKKKAPAGHRGRPKGSINRRTRERLVAAGHDPDVMTRERICEVMAGIRRDEYEKSKADRKRARELDRAARNGKVA